MIKNKIPDGPTSSILHPFKIHFVVSNVRQTTFLTQTIFVVRSTRPHDKAVVLNIGSVDLQGST